MPSVEVQHIAKSFGNTKAVEDVSFSVEPGEIFGLLGPNGAGKTTAIRILLDIFRPDHGTVAVLGGPLSEEKKARIGYMPEERGLYLDQPLETCLLYLASLKGMPGRDARTRLEELLVRFDLAPHRRKKVKELSKGMQQKAQIILTILHRPELIVIDEPFTSLDPVNVQLVKDLLRDLRRDGVTILMSTHQMHQVEELCDRILLIHRGRDVLYGPLKEIQKKFTGHAVLVRTAGELPRIHGVKETTSENHGYRLSLDDATTPQEVLRALVENGAILEKFEIAVPSLNEIFIRVVEGGEKP
jgi:ABC-2 type transport system ATP-binding protein